MQSQRYGSESAQVPVENHRSGLQRAFDILRQNVSSSINKEVSAVGHRIVHGGSLTESCRLDSAAKTEVQRAAAFAPLHNPPALDGVRACEECFPGRSQVRTLPGHHLCMLDWRVPGTFRTLPCAACKRRTWGEDICWVLTWLTAQCTCNNLAAQLAICIVSILVVLFKQSITAALQMSWHVCVHAGWCLRYSVPSNDAASCARLCAAI